MAVGTLELHLPGVGSLKEKRRVLKGLKEKVKHRFGVAVAEVDNLDSWQRATLGVASVSHDSRHANEVVSKAVAYIESLIDGHVIDIQIEVL
ncbi:MAG: DUF503 domain-containing protein [Candidatus Rokubacteria bacterium]|nr:DUF503 domain-containing protein [Candidatus Rokubacteria bacterium]